MAMTEAAYVGKELEVFAHAANWKAYVHSHLRPYVTGNVLEVGAGIGSNTGIYFNGQSRWVCLEPDPSLAGSIPRDGHLAQCEIVVGTLRQLQPTDLFDMILYIDVLEHIEDDAGELTLAVQHLRPGGRIAVMSPAHPWLYTPFDKAIGHYRRYTRRTLAGITPPGATLRVLKYLDSVGMGASLGNKLLLQSAAPSLRQIHVWDRLMVPLSRYVDPVLGYRLGKSVLAIWEKT